MLPLRVFTIRLQGAIPGLLLESGSSDFAPLFTLPVFHQNNPLAHGNFLGVPASLALPCLHIIRASTLLSKEHLSLSREQANLLVSSFSLSEPSNPGNRVCVVETR